MKEVSAKDFFRLCSGAKRVGIENVEGAYGWESTVFEYRGVSGDVLYKIETRPPKSNSVITTRFFRG